MKTNDEDGDAHAGRKGRKWFCVEKKGKKEKKKKEMECVVSNLPKNIRKDNPKIMKLPIYPYNKI